ncbi:hypothetical protein NQ315_016997 [Exocentrus adspersus]|uniref:FYVE-type domain-containing protein n=1 Tax=Exocentrus adspersus TaxID=1586481 RepID=A0AAV8VAX6_9CUCU|nr:hypothetical protein NQ315_016997 [Exocentrus adspersus]
MEKYAVDLDQVLNDFEYSELTDQYSSSASRSAAAGAAPSPSLNTVTKHSINNVFHSLNEYLNTSINTLDNNLLLENKENYNGEANTLTVTRNKLRDEEKSIKDCNLKTDAVLLDFYEQPNQNNNVCFEERSKVVDVKTTDVNNKEPCTEEATATVVREEEKLVEIEEEKTEVYINGDGQENIPQVFESSETSTDVAPVKAEDTLLEQEDVSETASPAESEEHREKIIGFEEDLELDENEVNKLLDELEDEEVESDGEPKPEVAKDAPLAASLECESETHACDESNKPFEAETPTPEAVNSSSAAESALPDDEKAVMEEDEDIKDTTDRSNEDSSTSDSEETTTVDTKVESEVTESVESGAQPAASADKSVGEPEVVTEEIKEQVMAKEDSADSLSRPQNLPLNGDGEQRKRKIDLIGEPGSTPYNNVYINKEIPERKEKSDDSDTDYSSSSSATFSDASSTTSTVSVNEAHNEETNLQTETEVAPVPTMEVSEVISPHEEEPTEDKQIDENQIPASETTTSDESMVDDTPSPGANAPQVENIGEVNVTAINLEKQWLGKEAPLWVPDSDATSCLHCDMKFTVLKRRHHCRACGLVLCSKCCHLRFRLEYLDAEARVCNKCHDILNKDTNSSSGSEMSPEVGNSPSHRPNPNNPLEYCSTVSPLQQVAATNPDPPAVMVPVGVLKRKGSNKGKSNKSVMFCDGIRPGSDLTSLDNDFEYNNTKSKKAEKTGAVAAAPKPKKNLPTVDPETNTFIPNSESALPPTVTVCKTDISYTDCSNGPAAVEMLKNEQLTFAIHVNLYVHVRIISMSCCINKTAWCFSSEGLINVGQDEVVILLEYIDEESFVPKDVFYHINNIYNDAVKGTTVKEMGISLHNASNFLDSKNHAGFVYIRPTFQCLENVVKPKETFLIGILIHRWETPWAKLFPLRLILRLGAEYRYYPSPIISTRHRESVFVEIGHTIINLLADFRNFSYTLPQIRGLVIHMEDKNTTITIPANRYDQVMKSISNSSDHILAFAGNFSQQADSHLVCIQDTQGNENCYSTHAINIHNKPRKGNGSKRFVFCGNVGVFVAVTGASFIVFNGALKSSSGLTAKSNIVEDGLMIQVLPEHMQQIRDNLRAMRNHTVPCGCVNAASDETVSIVWGGNDVNFNMGVVSAIDNTPLSGVPSIRVHNAKNHVCSNGNRFIRWTEVFIVQNGDDNAKNQDSVDISRVSESIAKATCEALVKYLDLLVANNSQKIGIRTTLHVDNVSYLAGSNGSKLPPIYMKSLDNELIPVLHRITTNNLGEHSIVLELVFRILNL